MVRNLYQVILRKEIVGNILWSNFLIPLFSSHLIKKQQKSKKKEKKKKEEYYPNDNILRLEFFL